MTDVNAVTDNRTGAPGARREVLGDPARFGGLLRRSVDDAALRRRDDGERQDRNGRAERARVDRGGGTRTSDTPASSLRRDRDLAEARDGRARIEHHHHGGTVRRTSATPSTKPEPDVSEEPGSEAHGSDATATTPNAATTAVTLATAATTSPNPAATGAPTRAAAPAADVAAAVPLPADEATVAASDDAAPSGPVTAPTTTTAPIDVPIDVPIDGATRPTSVAAPDVAAPDVVVSGVVASGASPTGAPEAGTAPDATAGAPTAAPDTGAPPDATATAVPSSPTPTLTPTPTAVPPPPPSTAASSSADNPILASLRAAARLAVVGSPGSPDGASAVAVAGAAKPGRDAHEDEPDGDRAKARPSSVTAAGGAPAPATAGATTTPASAAPVTAPARAEAVARAMELGTRVDHGGQFTGRLALELDDATRVSVRLDGRSVRMEVLDDRNQRLGQAFHSDVAEGFSRRGLEYQREGTDTSGRRDRPDDDPQHQSARDGGPSVARRRPFAIDPSALDRAAEPKAST